MTRQEVLELVAQAAINARKSGYWEPTGGSTISVTQEVRDLNQALNILEQGLCPECKGSGFDPKDLCDHNEVPDPCPVCHGAKYLSPSAPTVAHGQGAYMGPTMSLEHPGDTVGAEAQAQAYRVGALAMAHYYHGEYATEQFKGDHAGRAMRSEHLEWAKANIGLVELPEPIDQEKE